MKKIHQTDPVRPRTPHFPCKAQAVTHAVIETNMGNIQLELDEVKAPKTVANFVNYAKKVLRQHDFPPRYRQFYDSRRRIYREYGSKTHR